MGLPTHDWFARHGKRGSTLPSAHCFVATVPGLRAGLVPVRVRVATWGTPTKAATERLPSKRWKSHVVALLSLGQGTNRLTSQATVAVVRVVLWHVQSRRKPRASALRGRPCTAATRVPVWLPAALGMT